MSYVKGTLSKDEEIKEVVKLHWFNYIFTGILAFIALLFVISYFASAELQKDTGTKWIVILFVLWALYDFLKLYTTEMVITNKRVICRKGIISVKTEELKNAKVESIEIKQSILGRIFGYATIWFSGTGTSKVKFEAVDDPWAIKSRVESIIGD